KNHATGAAGHMVLPVHSRERGDVAEIADRTALDPRAMRLAAILDHLDAVPVRFAYDADDVGGAAERMHDDGGAHVRRDAGGELLRPHVETARRAVGEAWHQVVQDDGR